MVPGVGPSAAASRPVLHDRVGLETHQRQAAGSASVVNDVREGPRDIAMVFQSYALYPHMTVYDNIALRPGSGK